LALESDEFVKAQLAQNVAENKQQMQDLFEQLKNIYAESKDKQNQKVKVEINSPEKTDFVYEIIKAYAENNSAKIEIQKQTEKSLICYVFGEDIFDELSVLCGNVKVVENTREFDATVVVLDEKIFSAEIDEADIEMKTSKSSGAGGQHINKTESAVKLLHVPTGITVECQDERSQTKNKERAMSLLKEKISQYYLKNNENYIKNQRNTIKNAIFSDTASVIFDLDKHKVIVPKLKKEYDIASVLDGNLKPISNDMSV
jgi:peptide chain release factor 1